MRHAIYLEDDFPFILVDVNVLCNSLICPELIHLHTTPFLKISQYSNIKALHGYMLYLTDSISILSNHSSIQFLGTASQKDHHRFTNTDICWHHSLSCSRSTSVLRTLTTYLKEPHF
ncbi:hypothetical protein EYC80_004858 [Monilinia laxa]|uniref:Uncharacterized protein n=1 Tax=Monilinia laxa TaxID=61186 RepID=A0A5N6KI98_MONLA|nr:hypothetical protein EYC80_004858 [Monilinia laxa]